MAPGRGRNRDRWRLGGGVVSALALASAGVAGCSGSHQGSGPPSSGWSSVVLPLMPKAQAVSLSGAAMLPDGTGWAVGTLSFTDGGGYKAMVEHWDGHLWSSVPADNPQSAGNQLFGVTAISAKDAWAVGSGGTGSDAPGANTTLIEHWDGTRWRALQQPQAPSLKTYEAVLTAVSAVSTDDVWAVGFSDGPLIVHWDGIRWSASPNPRLQSGSGLQGVAGVSAGDVWAVGSGSVAKNDACLIEHWDGAAWSAVACPVPAGAAQASLKAVTAFSATDIWAVGFYTTGSEASAKAHGLIEHFDGRAWSIVPAPRLGIVTGLAAGDDGLTAVAGRSPDDLYAAGAEGRFVHWDGKSWTLTANQAPGVTIEAISAAPAAATVWAVGERIDGKTLDPIGIAETK